MFQSTHPRGVRLFMASNRCESKGFNPRTHAGCDPGPRTPYNRHSRVSIHAPTRGATVPTYRPAIVVVELLLLANP